MLQERSVAPKPRSLDSPNWGFPMKGVPLGSSGDVCVEGCGGVHCSILSDKAWPPPRISPGSRAHPAWATATGSTAAGSDIGRVDRVEDFFEDYRLGWAGGHHLAQHILINRARVEQLWLDELSLTPLERRRSEDDAGSRPDAPTPVDDDSHCHRMPALIAYSMASVSESTPSFDSKSVTSV